jgi:hypothetical protein
MSCVFSCFCFLFFVSRQQQEAQQGEIVESASSNDAETLDGPRLRHRFAQSRRRNPFDILHKQGAHEQASDGDAADRVARDDKALEELRRYRLHAAAKRRQHRPVPAQQQPLQHGAHDPAGVTRVAIVGLVRSARRVIAARVRELALFACTAGFEVGLYIIEGGSSDDTKDILATLQLTTTCRSDGRKAFSPFEVVDERDLATLTPTCKRALGGETWNQGVAGGAKEVVGEGQLEGRVQRLRALRSCSLELIRQREGAKVDAVIVADYEMERFPTPAAIATSVATVLPPDRRPSGVSVDDEGGSGYHALCAFGVTVFKLRMWMPQFYYDS